MRNIKYVSLSLVVAGLALSSCSDSFLDHEMDERTTIDNENKVVNLLKSAYPTVSIFSKVLIQQQIMSGLPSFQATT